MLKLEILFKSGETRVVVIEPTDGADLQEVIKDFAKAINTMNYITVPDPKTGGYVYVKLDDASFVSVRAA